ncbi:MAG TPA: pre-peptidase C-terminal domain-containing protein, partial [Minicystis sp.]|nr:pre-peptidase C-terminal domain-containing protein [Minicystis sp.]
MKSFVLGTVFVGAIVAVASVGAGCGGNDKPGTGGGGGTGGATSSSHSSSSSHITTGTITGSGGSGGSGQGHSFDTALPIMVNDMNPTMGMLPDPTTSQDFYKFTGTKGEKVAVSTTAKPSTNGFDPTYLDLVVTLYDASKQQIARQDDPWPRFSNDPQLFTYLPADGDYYVEVQECNAVFGTMNCSSASMITNYDYTVQVFDFGATAQNTVTDGKDETPGAHTDDDPANANVLKYVKSSGKYELTFLDGTFVDGTDVDVYAFTTPSDPTVDMGQRANADFWIAPSGKDDDGATSPVGLAWVVDSADPTTILAQLDASKYGDNDNPTNGAADLGLPVQEAHQYFLFVQHPASSAGSNDFYVVEHFVGGVNPVETEPNDPMMPEPLMMPQMNGDGSNSYFIEGDVAPGDTDGFAIPKGSMTKVSAFCAGARIGSGATLHYQLNADTS